MHAYISIIEARVAAFVLGMTEATYSISTMSRSSINTFRNPLANPRERLVWIRIQRLARQLSWRSPARSYVQ